MDGRPGLKRRLFPNAGDLRGDGPAEEYLRGFAEQPDAVVRGLAWALGALHAGFSLPRAAVLALTRSLSLGRINDGMYVNYLYTALWTVALLALLLAGNWAGTGALAAVAAAVGGWRLIEISAWWLKLLFDRAHDLVVSPERNLLFLLLDGVGVSFAVALLFDLDAPRLGAATHWVDALSVGTLSGAPGDVHRGPWTELGVVTGTLAGLLLFAAGLALLVGLITEKFKEADRPYAEPLRPPLSAVRRDGKRQTRLD